MQLAEDPGPVGLRPRGARPGERPGRAPQGNVRDARPRGTSGTRAPGERPGRAPQGNVRDARPRGASGRAPQESVRDARPRRTSGTRAPEERPDAAVGVVDVKWLRFDPRSCTFDRRWRQNVKHLTRAARSFTLCRCESPGGSCKLGASRPPPARGLGGSARIEALHRGQTRPLTQPRGRVPERRAVVAPDVAVHLRERGVRM
jgi:hypothetical protein